MNLDERIAADAQMLGHLGIGVDGPSLARANEGQPSAQDALLYLDVAQHMVNALQFCHGGILYTLADTACAYALGSETFAPATVDANVTYLRPARLGERVQAYTEVQKQSQRLGTCEVRLRNPAGELLLVYRGTCANARRS